MNQGQWSRSRFWLCHFLFSRHERLAVNWQADAHCPPRLDEALTGWLQHRRRPQAAMIESARRLVADAVDRNRDDPAYIQCLRLLVKERQYQHELAQRWLARPGGHDQSRRRKGTFATIHRRIAAWRFMLLGARFEMSVQFFADLYDLSVMSMAAGSGSGSVAADVAANLAHDKRAHVAFAAERLTMLYADFNSLRRNLRRLRLRGIWLTCLLRCVARDGRLIKACGRSRWQFLFAALRQFDQLLETMVPYRRDALLKALMSQRQQPYAKPHQLLTR